MKLSALTKNSLLLTTTVVTIGLVVGILCTIFGQKNAAHIAWALTIILVLIPLTWDIIKDLKTGRFGVDIIALLAMVGALVVEEYLAGAIVALMLSGGGALEELAQRKAAKSLTTLIERAPNEARVKRGEQIVEVDVADILSGDIVLVRTGEVVPVDGSLISERAALDQSMLTGEPLPIEVHKGDLVMSGSISSGGSFELVATKSAAESSYASIVSLVQDALAIKAPMVRMADRYAVVFLLVTLIATAIAWIMSGDPVRAIAVLVIATPCPLILSPPVALVGGTSRAAKKGLIIKGASTVERLGQVNSVLIDKTGTITTGEPQVTNIHTHLEVSTQEILLMAAALEQHSVHPLALAIVRAAKDIKEVAYNAKDVKESPGHGLSGYVNGKSVLVGSKSYLEKLNVKISEEVKSCDSALVYVAFDGVHEATIEINDAIRSDAKEMIDALKAANINQITLATGDAEEPARDVAKLVGIDEVKANCTPQQKLQILERMKSNSKQVVMMVGDGVNDAPALAAADVGVAIAGEGATVASDTADVVLLSKSIKTVADSISIGRRSRTIALQSIVAGMTLSMAGMFFAGIGMLRPVDGALLQEVIDLAVIINALRALKDG